jgi:hypothetical protein
MTLIHNEQTKLIANALDRASTGCFTVGIATPIAGFLYNVGDFGSTVSWLRLTISLTGWLFASVALHFYSRYVLKGLKQ